MIICVFCGASEFSHTEYVDAASALGRRLAQAKVTVHYGAGAWGPMGALADAVLASDGRVVGVMPRFMHDLGWSHPRLSELVLTADMHERKKRMVAGTDAVVALPGGSGTIEELFEVVTSKRLGLYLGPIVLVNTRGFFDPLIRLFRAMVDDGFMEQGHHEIWRTVQTPEQALDAIATGPKWVKGQRGFAERAITRTPYCEAPMNCPSDQPPS